VGVAVSKEITQPNDTGPNQTNFAFHGDACLSYIKVCRCFFLFPLIRYNGLSLRQGQRVRRNSVGVGARVRFFCFTSSSWFRVRCRWAMENIRALAEDKDSCFSVWWIFERMAGGGLSGRAAGRQGGREAGRLRGGWGLFVPLFSLFFAFIRSLVLRALYSPTPLDVITVRAVERIARCKRARCLLIKRNIDKSDFFLFSPLC
jgi:hypothetical protein